MISTYKWLHSKKHYTLAYTAPNTLHCNPIVSTFYCNAGRHSHQGSEQISSRDIQTETMHTCVDMRLLFMYKPIIATL